MEFKENDFFVYKIKDDKVSIEKYKDQSPVVEIPREVEGKSVTALGDYVLSGLPCESVHIPQGVKKIGRYGFYNCRGLSHLEFHSDFMDIGSGAFTGCHHIGRLDVHMEKEETGLKEILSEVMEELCVRLHGMYEAVLWFPEFYEEGVENTPARILMTQVHGSGLYYRNCFQGKKFNFMEYDRRFEMACAQESEGFLTELVLGRLSHPCALGREAKEKYESWLSAHYKKTALMLVQKEREEELEWMLNTYPPAEKSRNGFMEILDAAADKGAPSMVSMLMEYKRIHFPAKRRVFDL